MNHHPAGPSVDMLVQAEFRKAHAVPRSCDARGGCGVSAAQPDGFGVEPEFGPLLGVRIGPSLIRCTVGGSA
jgi:hypothetical protein